MNKVWEFLHENQEKIRYQQTEYFSPYYEVSEEAIIQTGKEAYQVGFNSFYRYEEVFEALFDTNINEQQKAFLFDCILHYLVHQEFRMGVTKNEYAIRYYWREMEEGGYGKLVQEVFYNLSKEKKHFLARTLYTQSRVQAGVSLFAKAVTEIMDNCVVYRNKIQPEVILIYLQEKNVSTGQKILMALEELFLPLNYSIRIFQEKHFGVIQAEQTMEMNQIEIF